MSKCYKAENVIERLDYCIHLADTGYFNYSQKMMQRLRDELADLPTIEVSEDCISREDLRRSLTRPLENNNADEMYWKGWHDCTVAVETRIADAPSVLPKRSCYRCGLREDCEDSTVRTAEQR